MSFPTPRRMRRLAVAGVAALSCGFLATAAPAAATNATSPSCDIQNDGAEDIVVSGVFEDVGGVDDPGAIWVIPAGNASGEADPSTLDLIDTANTQFFSQSTPGVPGASEANDFWGTALACGDFNNDNFADVIIGAEFEDIGSVTDAGAITVLFGSASGLTTSGAQAITQSTAGVPGASEAGDLFGHSLAVGDFNGDGIDDVAVGGPGEGIGAFNDAGAVWIIHGSNSGLSTSGIQVITQSSPGVAGASETGDGFGFRLAVGDIDGDDNDDLVIGAPGEDVGSVVDAGGIWIVRGNGSQLDSPNAKVLTQSTADVLGASEAMDFFGSQLSVFDITGDGNDDLFVSGVGEDIGAVVDAGAIWMFQGGPVSTINTRDFGIAEAVPEATAAFGSSLAPYTTASGELALLTGVPGHDRISGQIGWFDHGLVRGVEWTGSDLTNGEQFTGEIAIDDGLVFTGDAINSGDYNGDGTLDYVVGSPGLNTEAGGIWVFNDDHDVRFIDQETPGVPGSGEFEDQFGFAIG